MHFAGSVDKDCLDREGHEGYEVHSPGLGLVGPPAGGAREALQLAAGAHSTTPHLPEPLYHEQTHYAPPAEPRASVIESSQPLIIECT